LLTYRACCNVVFLNSVMYLSGVCEPPWAPQPNCFLTNHAPPPLRFNALIDMNWSYLCNQHQSTLLARIYQMRHCFSFRHIKNTPWYVCNYRHNVIPSSCCASQLISHKNLRTPCKTCDDECIVCDELVRYELDAHEYMFL